MDENELSTTEDLVFTPIISRRDIGIQTDDNPPDEYAFVIGVGTSEPSIPYGIDLNLTEAENAMLC